MKPEKEMLTRMKLSGTLSFLYFIVATRTMKFKGVPAKKHKTHKGGLQVKGPDRGQVILGPLKGTDFGDVLVQVEVFSHCDPELFAAAAVSASYIRS